MNDIIQTVREAVENFYHIGSPEHNRLVNNAAPEWLLQLCDQVEAQAKEIEGMRAEIERLKQIRYNATEAHVSIQSRQTEEIEKLREQRDAAVTALEQLKNRVSVDPNHNNSHEYTKACQALSHIKGGEG